MHQPSKEKPVVQYICNRCLLQGLHPDHVLSQISIWTDERSCQDRDHEPNEHLNAWLDIHRLLVVVRSSVSVAWLSYSVVDWMGKIELEPQVTQHKLASIQIGLGVSMSSFSKSSLFAENSSVRVRHSQIGSLE